MYSDWNSWFKEFVLGRAQEVKVNPFYVLNMY